MCLRLLLNSCLFTGFLRDTNVMIGVQVIRLEVLLPLRCLIVLLEPLILDIRIITLCCTIICFQGFHQVRPHRKRLPKLCVLSCSLGVCFTTFAATIFVCVVSCCFFRCICLRLVLGVVCVCASSGVWSHCCAYGGVSCSSCVLCPGWVGFVISCIACVAGFGMSCSSLRRAVFCECLLL